MTSQADIDRLVVELANLATERADAASDLESTTRESAPILEEQRA